MDFVKIFNQMDLMELPPGISGKREETLTGDELDIFRVGKQATIAFSLFARSPRVRKEVYHHGVLKLLPKLLSSKDQDTSLAALNVLMLCSSVPEFKTSVEAHGLISFILKNLTSGDSKREELSCRALYRLSDSELSQKQARTYKVLQALVGLMKDDTKTTKVLKYAAGSVMRCANDKENVAVLGEMSIIGTLIRLLKHKTDSVATHAAGILASLAHITSNREAIKRLNGLPVLMELMSKSHCEPLLAHVVKVIGDCAYNENCMEDLQEMDTLRLVWSLLNMRDPSVKANAAWALVPIIKRFKISGEVIRSFAGALEILINLLDHPDHRVKAGACSALAYVAYDEINLSIITDLGVVHKLCNLVTIDSDVLRENMCIAIASVSRKPSNSMELGRLGCIDPIVQFLGSKNEEVVTAAAFALWKLSSDPINCIALHKSGVVPFLLECIGSESFPLQTAAAGCLNNIRGVAYEADLIKNVGRLITVPRMKKSFRTKSVVEAVLEAEKEQVERFKESQNREDDD